MKHDWIISQIGARQHFGVPRGFEATGQLKRLYTDVWCPRPLRFLRRGSTAMRAFASRFHPQVPPSKVVAFNLRGVADGFRHSAAKNWTVEETHLDYLRIGETFDRDVVRHLSGRGRLDPEREAFFGFNTGSLETLQFLRARGVVTVLDQIDPAKVEEDMVAAEAERWPGWEKVRGRVPKAYWDRMKSEWDTANIVLVNSNWSKTALIAQGVPAEKIIVVPVAYEPSGGPVPFRKLRRRTAHGAVAGERHFAQGHSVPG